jgi:hypothetical protein
MHIYQPILLCKIKLIIQPKFFFRPDIFTITFVSEFRWSLSNTNYFEYKRFSVAKKNIKKNLKKLANYMEWKTQLKIILCWVQQDLVGQPGKRDCP